MKGSWVCVLPGRQSPWLLSVFLLCAWATASSATAVDVELVSHRKGVLPLYQAGAGGEHDTYRAYVEAKKGERYGIRIRNNTGRRVGVVVAVDGRNIISGKKSHLRSRERMYILGPYESETYDGWRTARDTVNRFYFTEPGNSYAGAFRDYSAMGVVAVAVYREKDARLPRTYDNREEEGTGREDGSGARAPGPGVPDEGAAGKLAPERSGDAAGTGFGKQKYSPSIRVQFTPEPLLERR